MTRRIRYVAGAALLLGASTGCSNAVSPDIDAPDTPNVPPPSTEPLYAEAGPDLFVAPEDSTLTLRVWTSALRAPEIMWTRISGPASLRIVQADSANARIVALAKGVYRLQVTVRDANGRVAMDTLAVHVVDDTAIKTLMIPLKGWVCPMGCTTQIGDVDALFPAGALMRVQFREGGSTAWREIHAVGGDGFFYQIANRQLYLYSNDMPNLTDVRLLWTMP